MDDATYIAFRQSAMADFLEARGNVELVRAATARYLRNGYAAGFVGPELIDYFCVDTPSILDDANYSESEIIAAVNILDELHPGIFRELGAKKI